MGQIKTIFQHVEETHAALYNFKKAVAEVKKNYEMGIITDFEYLHQLTDVCVTAEKQITEGRDAQDVHDAHVIVNYLAGIKLQNL